MERDIAAVLASDSSMMQAGSSAGMQSHLPLAHQLVLNVALSEAIAKPPAAVSQVGVPDES